MTAPATLLEARKLAKFYPVEGGARGARLHAVDEVDLVVGAGESVGLVGESGCGKSTTVRLLARLVDPSSGTIALSGRDITEVSQVRFVRSPDRARIQVVFQDPTESLNPSFRVFRAIADPLKRLQGLRNATDIEARVRRAAELVGLPLELLQRYPHQLSGGQRARVGIARAIAVEPSLLILDEPTSALDVSVQAVVLKLLAELRERLGMSYLFVSHSTSCDCSVRASRSCIWERLSRSVPPRRSSPIRIIPTRPRLSAPFLTRSPGGPAASSRRQSDKPDRSRSTHLPLLQPLCKERRHLQSRHASVANSGPRSRRRLSLSLRELS